MSPLPPPSFAPPYHQVDGHALPDRADRAPIAGSLAFTATGETIQAFDVRAFRPMWRMRPPGPITEQGLALGRDLYASGKVWGSTPGRVTAIDQRTGRIRWSVKKLGRGTGVGADRRGVYASVTSGTISALEPGSGRVRWTTKVADPPRVEGGAGDVETVVPVTTPASGGRTAETTIVVQYGQNAIGIDAARGRKLWSHPTGYVSEPAFPAVDGIVAIETKTGLAGYDARTGGVRWSAGAVDPSEGMTLFAGRLVVLGKGRVTALDPRRGTALWSHPVGRADVSGGYQFLRSLGDLLIVRGMDRTLGISAKGEVVWSGRAGLSLDPPLWTDGRSLTTLGGRSFFRYRRGEAAPLPTDALARRRLAETMTARYERLDARSVARLMKLGNAAFPPLLRAFLAAGRAYGTAADHRRQSFYDLATDLAPLVARTADRSATPSLVRAIETSGPKAFVTPYLLATLGRVGDPALATPLFLRLASAPIGQDEWRNARSVAFDALVHSSDPRAIAEMTRRLGDAATPLEERDEIYRHLAGTGGDAGLRAVLAARTPRRLLPTIEARLHLDDLGERKTSRLLAQKVDTSGRTWGLVASPILGSRGDLWLVERIDGRWRSPRFTGVSTDGISRWMKSPPPEPRIGGKTAKELVAGAWFSVLVGREELARDRDGDGLTDLAELRLGTDPENPDMDGDGDRDEIDPMPNAPLRPLNDEEAVLAAAFEALHRGRDAYAAELTTPPGMRPFEMVGWNGPVVWREGDEKAPFGSELARHYEQGVGFLGFDLRDSGFERVVFDAARTEATIGLRTYFGGLSGAGYQAVVRKFGTEWVVVSMRMTYIS